MGKPRMIILIRHAQSEGNKNRSIHQFIPDHRVKLTSDGWNQAYDAGRRLRGMLRPDDTLQFFTSPYRRTRETTEGILKTLTEDDPTPSPFPRHTITVYEEPRLREQDFGNFQPCSAEMERMWQERADYGHFFYRIPNGESAADAYDRVAGFNESLWRQFGDQDFPSVCVLVTHGLMSRVFLMKWYHWSVEYFEDLRNVNHCEFIIMRHNAENGKFMLENQLRTWSELKKRAASMAASDDKGRSGSVSKSSGPPKPRESSPGIPTRRWGGCANGCNHAEMQYQRKPRRQNTADFVQTVQKEVKKSETDDHAVAQKPAEQLAEVADHKQTPSDPDAPADPSSLLSPGFASASSQSDSDDPPSSDGDSAEGPRRPKPMSFLNVGRDFGGSRSGVGTPAEGFSDDSDYFNPPAPHDHAPSKAKDKENSKSATKKPARASSKRESRERKASIKQWEKESGMFAGAKADRLGDDEEVGTDVAIGKTAPRKGAAMKEAMAIADGGGSASDGGDVGAGGTVSMMVDKMKERDRKSMREVY